MRKQQPRFYWSCSSVVMKDATHWRPLAHERNSIFKCKPTVNQLSRLLGKLTNRVMFVRLYRNTGYCLSACENLWGTICPRVQIDGVLFVRMCKSTGYYLSVTRSLRTRTIWLHNDELRGDILQPPHRHLTPAAVSWMNLEKVCRFCFQQTCWRRQYNSSQQWPHLHMYVLLCFFRLTTRPHWCLSNL